MADQVRNFKIRYSTEDSATGPINALSASLVTASTRSSKLSVDLNKLALAINGIGTSAEWSDDAVRRLNEALAGIPKGAANQASQISGGFGRIDFNAQTAARSVEGLGAALANVAGRSSGINATQGAMQGLQRTTFGAMKNTEDLNAQLSKIPGSTAGISTTSGALRTLGDSARKADPPTQQLNQSFGNLVPTMLGIHAARTVISEVGDAIRDAREDTRGWAQDALKLRDELRELANLKGKPGADNGVLADNLRLRIQTGMTQPEARKFQEQFLGSLPLAKDAGGITDQVALDLSGQVGRLATRVGLDGGTAGDLAGTLGMFGRIPDAQVGLGRSQQIVDLLNDGRGNLTPLTRALLKGAASTVGQGKAFASLAERAAAISVATGIGDKGATDTTVGAAIRGLSAGGTVEHRKTLERLGIGGNQDLLTRLDRLKPLFDEGRARGDSPNDTLLKAGFGNITDRRAIVGFYENRETLRKRIESVREDPNAPDQKARAAAARSAGLNEDFYTSDRAARNRVADAKLEAQKLRRGVQGENLEIARKEAEERLQRDRAIDTPGTNFIDRARNLFGVGEMLGLDSGRQQRIDDEVKRRAVELAKADPSKPRDDFNNLNVSVSAEYIARRERAINAARVGNRLAVRPNVLGGPGNPGQAQNQDAGPRIPEAIARPAPASAPKVGNQAVVDAIKRLEDAVVGTLRQAGSVRPGAPRVFAERP